MQFPHKCVRCGFCCLRHPCPEAMMRVGADYNQPCPLLRWSGETTYCELCDAVPHSIMGFGAGCCINFKWRIEGSHTIYDFASLPDEIKVRLAQAYKKNVEVNLIDTAG